ncbi:protein Niban 1a [Electrophorus electricus]|uniref:protein Niban 1a n=1 Tax=Electrophorus electricus TaxID=8005 RepID=UPI0015CFF45A|nr:protein Niban 1a [Electrophorus electricus]
MGSSSSLLDESKCSFIKGRAQAELESFAPVYRKQYLLAFLSHVHDEQVQRKEEHTQILKCREPPPESDVLYMSNVLNFTDHRKWKERFAVVRASYCLECHETFESFESGTPPVYTLLPTGGAIFTTEEKYMERVDKSFPDANDKNDDFAPPADSIPEDFPVYLQLPYRRDYYFCFQDDDQQAAFMSILSDCIRHQNQDFLKKKDYEVQAFVKAVQLYRQSAGHYESWDMLLGSDARVLANLTMERLLPTVGKVLLSSLKAKKSEKKRMWFAVVEEMYFLVQQTMKEGMASLKKQCTEAVKKHSVLARSDMDQIMTSRAFVEAKVRATVGEAAGRYCAEKVEPHLPALLEEVMGPISLGFLEARKLSEAMMERLCQDYEEGVIGEELQQAWEEIRRPDLQSCYEKVNGLREHTQKLQQSFSYPSSKRLEQSTQIEIQQLVDNVAYTFELFLHKAKENKSNIADAMVKARHRVLKQYDYDSSSVRKMIFTQALLEITLPSARAHLAPAVKNELPAFEQYIFADYVNFINVENIYEDILHQILGDEIRKVVNEAASMKKYNLFTDSRFNFSLSESSRSLAFSSPSPALRHAKPASLLSSRPPTCQSQLDLPVSTPGTGVPGSRLVALDNGTAGSVVDREKEVVHTNSEPSTAASFPTVTPLDPAGSVHTEPTLLKPSVSPTVTAQTLVNPVLRALEIVNNRMQINSSSAEGGRGLLNQAAPNEDPISPAPASRETENAAPCSINSVLESASCNSYRKGMVTVPPTGVEKGHNWAAETEAVVDVPLEPTSHVASSDDAVRISKDKEVLDSTGDKVVFPDLKEPNESVVFSCEAVPNASASLALCLADSDASSPAGGAAEARPATRPPDCIKDIRDLVVEVTEVVEIVQPYPDVEF